MKSIQKMMISGKEVYPIIEGGKGVGITNGETAGAFAAAGAVGTFSGVHALLYDEEGNYVPMDLKGKNRLERTRERIEYAIKGALSQIRIAHNKSNGNGRIHMNLLWGMMGTEEIIRRVLEQAEGKLHGVTCGAGMPYQLGEICAEHKTYYYPIVSSARAFMVLWKRAYNKHPEWLGGVVYEDPWKAGGHNGLSNKENPEKPEPPYERVVELRKMMDRFGLQEVPIVMAGGVWTIDEFKDWIDNPEIGKIAFQLGTRPLLTQESPIPDAFKQKLLNLQPEDITLNKFSPTGFYSSAIINDFLKEQFAMSDRQVEFKKEQDDEFEIPNGRYFIKKEDKERVTSWIESGFTEGLRTPDDTLMYVSEDKAKQIKADQQGCSGCLAACKFSSWAASEEHRFTTGNRMDPRSFCIMNTLQYLVDDKDAEKQLMFAGHSAFRFQKDPLYKDGYIPSVKELVSQLVQFK
ncbi:NAD(P)H-dependent flavin oxidoreductase [Sediminitomix flava]|uniref:NAD(P)H-dependent flavin oxidoreductase YrpB (Nitropropane dioxygenase family) n=1 Tax=Sediminitomix flava TaxID=379075 RepID=A0A315Z755_SEDFL|nr:nitronate monooxygenase [Sediminitomix flava]PWJ40163.1 NAD(P)H-dependent flavin oxidoreductase YrpB (nitropropane dioxygenase family) [Sediminitomix flava]